MAKSVFALLDDLAENVAGLKAALSPLLAIATGPTSSRRATTTRRRRRTRRNTATKSTVRRNAAAAPTKARRKTSPALHAKRVLQGRYLGAIRPLSKANRARVKAVQAKSGYDAAIKLAQRLKK
jgi:hypothetical protein